MGCSVTPPPGPPPLLSRHHRQNPNPIAHLTRRSIFLSTPLSLALKPPPSYTSPPFPPPPDTTITDRIFMDFSLYATYFRPLSSPDPKPNLCPDSIPLGRLVLGLYGHLVPFIVANFKSMCTSYAYKGTIIHKFFPSQFFLAGYQGDKPGKIQRPSSLARNAETVDSKSFALTHHRPASSPSASSRTTMRTTSTQPGIPNVEFFITTGPLDPTSAPSSITRTSLRKTFPINFGLLCLGMDVVTAIATIPTCRPSENIQQFNDFAEFLGDKRAGNARALWNKPLKTVYISDCGRK
ncbi:peptidyl-prolyl cis-trans isomerase CYP28 [Pyrus ussuriensis x Pyrus communis]|uniref:Peptidyl-prolyl cis-trans isomerase CYP28 n=1 Tax=Pyrus ussuriensis x Pyrus communis TaxID=2448454 RepID=A0A5N5GT25_9ROSA|nr:peptidyl-prolyl cis-trans isomerase CYP28 [Pyrus ussuriensis x Pyrus communis]